DTAYDDFVDSLLEEYETLYEVFENVAADPEEFREEYSGDWVETFIEVAVDNVTPPFVQIDGILELTSRAADGVERIRAALMKGLEVAEDSNIEITSVGSPRYRIVITADEYKDAEEIMKKVSAAAIDSIVAAGGEGSLKRETK
ncbi:MAG: translation initiation factor IF-2 subunit alpha, partial [Candidatus Methanomethylophilaceae archaeon]|nr:translation initiation factor IF-2 subunit alpha [Candidatus Methanomethylophilaceae archaeon]